VVQQVFARKGSSMLLQKLDAAPEVGLRREAPFRCQFTGHLARIDAEQDPKWDPVRFPIGECCQPIGPKAREGKVSNRGAWVPGHANSHYRRDRVHQVRERFDLHGAIFWNFYFFGCCVQFWTSILQIQLGRERLLGLLLAGSALEEALTTSPQKDQPQPSSEGRG